MSESVLVEAERIINGDRRQDYGDVLPGFEMVASMWSAVLGVDVTAEQVCLCMVLLKVQRAANGYQRDSLVDIAGYAGCLELIRMHRGARAGASDSTKTEAGQ